MPTWEKVDVPVGTYIGWGNKPKQHVTGTVLDYDPTGGTDFNDKVCPLLEIELTERAASFNRDLERTNYDKGEVVFLTCGLVSLKRAIKKAEPERGDLIKIELESTEKVDKGTVKVFGIQIARGAGKVSDKAKAESPAHDDDDDDDDEPPF
jgi:hypothetical protein